MAEAKKGEARKKIDEFVPEQAREHIRAARDELRKSYETIFPPGFIKHQRAARREFLKAARSLIDRALERIDEAEAA